MPRKPTATDCLAAQRPDVAATWNPTWNGDKTPQDFLAGSGVRAWWKCELDHVWETKICTRTSGHGCPYCSGNKVLAGFNDLATKAPEVATEWHPKKNGALKSSQIIAGSHAKAWWQCALGHEWRAEIGSRVADHGCPVCDGKITIAGFNDLASKNPELAWQWHPTKNRQLTPDGITVSSGRSIWWKCAFGHSWKATVANRNRGAGCPACARGSVPTRPVERLICDERL